MSTPHEKGNALEDAVAAIEGGHSPFLGGSRPTTDHREKENNHRKRSPSRIDVFVTADIAPATSQFLSLSARIGRKR